MTVEDQTLTCEDCKQTFVWTESEQAFYAKKDFATPKRCKPCREARKAAFLKRTQGSLEGSKNITCETCHETFVWTKREQDFYVKSRFDPPKHCAACREKRKTERKRKPKRVSGRNRVDARAYVD